MTKKQTFPPTDDPSRQYFSDHHPDQWDFPHFRSCFPEGPVNTALNDYQNALSWISKHLIDSTIRHHVATLRKEWKKPSSVKKELSMPPASINLNVGRVNMAGNIIGDNGAITVVQDSKKRQREEVEDEDNGGQRASSSKVPRSFHDKEEEQVHGDNQEQVYDEQEQVYGDEEEQVESDQQEQTDDDESEEGDVKVLSLWDGWLQFLEDHNGESSSDVLDPEASGVLWCGSGVSKRDYIPNDLYEGVQEVVKEDQRKQEKVHTGIKKYIDAVLDAPSFDELEDTIKHMTMAEATNHHRSKVLFLEYILTAMVNNIYSGTVDPTHTESSWNTAILHPILIACARYITRESKIRVVFAPGEEELYSMATSRPENSSSRYLADGVMRFHNTSNLEICLLETSQAMNKGSAAKISFDHRKGMFGLLAMMKRLAHAYKMATYESLSSVKLFFAHAHGNAIRIWSLSTPQPNVYVMHKELKIDIPTVFDKKDEDLLSLMTSCWKFVHLLVRSVDCIQELEQCHKEKKRLMRYEEGGDAQYLNTLVNPRILKITEKKHKVLVGADGPRSSPMGQTEDFSSGSSGDDF